MSDLKSVGIKCEKLKMGFAVEKVVKIVNDLCKSQKSRLANIHPLSKVIYTKGHKN